MMIKYFHSKMVNMDAKLIRQIFIRIVLFLNTFEYLFVLFLDVRWVLNDTSEKDTKKFNQMAKIKHLKQLTKSLLYLLNFPKIWQKSSYIKHLVISSKELYMDIFELYKGFWSFLGKSAAKKLELYSLSVYNNCF